MATKTIDPKLLENVERPLVKNGKLVTETKKVRRAGEVIEEEIPKMRAVKAEEVFSHAIRGDEVVVATTDGRKFRGPLPKGYKVPEPPAPSGQQPAGAKGADPEKKE